MKTITTRSQYDALLLIAEDGEKFKACELNIRPQTLERDCRTWLDRCEKRIRNGFKQGLV